MSLEKRALPRQPAHAGTASPVVSIWILDKRAMAEGGASPAEIEAAAETSRRDAGALARLKHPAIVKVSGMPLSPVSRGESTRNP